MKPYELSSWYVLRVFNSIINHVTHVFKKKGQPPGLLSGAGVL